MLLASKDGIWAKLYWHDGLAIATGMHEFRW